MRLNDSLDFRFWGFGRVAARLYGGSNWLPARYHGAWQARPPLCDGLAPYAEDIGRAVQLIRRILWLWLAVIFPGGLILA
jgi:cobalamin biosynthesis protein CobD/CbiB